MLTLRGPIGPRRGPDLNELNVIESGSLLIRDGALEQIGSTRRIENLVEARNAVEINAAGKVVMPSFVDCHTHLAYPPPDVSDDAHAAASHALMVAAGNRLALCWRTHLETMARHGTTTVGIKTGAGPDALAEYKLMRILCKLQGDPLDIAPSLLFRLPADERREAESAEYTALVCSELLPKIRLRKLARLAEIAWDPAAAHQPLFRRFLSAAAELGFQCKVHADRSHAAIAIAMAAEHKAIAVSHLEQATISDASAMAGSGIIATLLPCAPFHTGAGNAPARALVDAGVPIALASDFHPAHSPMLNMQAVISLACLRMGLTPAEAVSAATINGAHALGCATRTGSLEPGKSADVVILNISDYRDLAHNLGSNLVYATMKHGVVIYREAKIGAVRPVPRDTPVLH